MNDASKIGYALNELVDSFMNIEKIHFRNASFEFILPFIHRSAKLNKMKVQTPQDDGLYCNEGIIDLPALNNERKKCAGGSKITIYVGEEFYLRTKGAFMQLQETNLALVELVRAESFAWELYSDE